MLLLLRLPVGAEVNAFGADADLACVGDALQIEAPYEVLASALVLIDLSVLQQVFCFLPIR